jgi:hypothetical protein
MRKRRAFRSKELKDLSRRVREVGLDAVGLIPLGKTQRLPGIAVLSQKERHAKRGLPVSRAVGRPGQSRPTRFSRQTQRVEPRGIVVVDTRRQNRAFPRRCRQLETIQHAKHRTEAVDSGKPMHGVDAVPCE